MKRTMAVALSALVAAACSDSSVVGPVPRNIPSAPNAEIVDGDVIVTNSNNAGPGSFRQAINDANANASIQTIAFHPSVNTIELQSQVLYTGAQNLTIKANHATINGAGASEAALRMNTVGADLTIIGLTVRDTPGQGVHVEVLPAATGVVKVTLVDVDIQNNTGHGVLVNDQLDPSTKDGEQPKADGSSASVEVVVVDSRIVGNGFSVSDRDGLRVNEGGLGDLTLTLDRVRSEQNGADGVEIDERGAGDIHLDVSGSSFTRNGVFDPTDLDDGFDIDEYNDGSIIGTVVETTANNNFEEGFDFNENNNGDLRVNMTRIRANENGEEGIDFEEDDDFGDSGDLVTVMDDIQTFGNGFGADGALKIREKQTGNLDVTLRNIQSSHNTSTGIFVRESSGGNALIHIENVVATANLAVLFPAPGDPVTRGHGVELLESGGGNMTATVVNATVSGNAGNGVFADASGSATASGVQGSGNALGLIGGIVIVVP